MAGQAVDQPIFVICDHECRGVVASDAYCDLLLRDRAALLGRRWDEWVDPIEGDKLRSHFAAAVGGGSSRYLRQAARADGGFVTIVGHCTPVRLDGTAYVLTSVNALFTTEMLRTDLRHHRAEVALHIEALSGSLAALVEAAGMTALSGSLGGVADEAARVARHLSHRFDRLDGGCARE